MTEWIGLLLTVVLLAVNGFFVAAEFALVAARRSVVEPQADRGRRGARSALRAMERVSLMMAGAQLGITVCSLGLGALSEPAIAHLLEPAFHALHVPSAAAHSIAFVIALGLVTVLHVIVGEVIPKNVALAGPERAAGVLAPPLLAVVTVFRPVIALLNAAVDAMLRFAGVTPRDEVASAFDRDQVAAMVAESHREGHLDADEAKLLSGAIGFAQRTAADVLVPAERVRVVPGGAGPDAVEDLAVSTGFSRFPLPDLSAYIHVKDAVAARGRGSAVIARPLPSVRSDAGLRSVLETMRAGRAHLVRVVDDADPVRVRGIVSMRDVLAELIGRR